MSRKIKFRAWNKANKEMIYPTGIRENDLYWGIEGTNNGFWGIFSSDKIICGNADDSGILMQYTGVKDKNGIDIYEGDIIKYGKNIFLIVYSENIASFTVDFERAYKKVNCYPNVNKGTMLSAEVIGNIYENPELLEGEE